MIAWNIQHWDWPISKELANLNAVRNVAGKHHQVSVWFGRNQALARPFGL
jgi:hypothetical protein